MTRRWIFWLPLLLGVLLLGLFYLGLKKPTDHVIVSRMIGQQLPVFTAPPALPGQPGASTADYKTGQPRLLNVFASWCLPCVAEIPVLLRIKAMGVPVDGIAVHDTTPALQAFLAKNGNPYERIGHDHNSKLQVALGSSGVPETFVIGGDGKVLYQHIGVVAEDDIPKLLGMMGQR